MVHGRVDRAVPWGDPLVEPHEIAAAQDEQVQPGQVVRESRQRVDLVRPAVRGEVVVRVADELVSTEPLAELTRGEQREEQIAEVRDGDRRNDSDAHGRRLRDAGSLVCAARGHYPSDLAGALHAVG